MIVGSMIVGSALIYLLAQDSGTDIPMATTDILMGTPTGILMGITVILIGTTGIAGGISVSMSSAHFRPSILAECLKSRTSTVWERLSNQIGTIYVGPIIEVNYFEVALTQTLLPSIS